MLTLFLLSSLLVLSSPTDGSCLPACGNCTHEFLWTEWTPFVYNITILSRAPTHDWFTAILEDGVGMVTILKCMQINSTVMVFTTSSPDQAPRSNPDFYGINFGRLERFDGGVQCRFSIYKSRLPTTPLNISVASGRSIPFDSDKYSSNSSTEYTEKAVTLNSHDRYNIKSSNPATPMILVHGSLMLLSHGMIFIYCIFVARYMRRVSNSARWRSTYILLVVLSVFLHIAGLACVSLHPQTLEYTSLRFHRNSSIFLTVALLAHLVISIIKHCDREHRACLSHLHMLLSMAVFLVAFAACFTGLAQLDGLPRSTINCFAGYMFWIIGVGFTFSEIVYVYYPVRIEKYYTLMKLSFAAISLVIMAFGVSVPIVLYFI